MDWDKVAPAKRDGQRGRKASNGEHNIVLDMVIMFVGVTPAFF